MSRKNWVRLALVSIASVFAIGGCSSTGILPWAVGGIVLANLLNGQHA